MEDMRTIINGERANDTLHYIGDEACGCPMYRVTAGKASAYMGPDDVMCMHNVGCAEAESTRDLIETWLLQGRKRVKRSAERHQ